jgi:aminoglycoside/choline kinase family phosphotransferase
MYDANMGIYLETDFGDTTLYRWQQALDDFQSKEKAMLGMYRRVIRWLIEFQIRGRDRLDFSKCYQYPSFNKEAMQYDLDYFVSSFLARFARIKYDKDRLQHDFDRLMHHLLKADASYFLYRDFQSKNIMLQDGALYFIDYQSGRKGALQYDLASLLFDANLRAPKTLRETIAAYYLETIDSYVALNENKFLTYYHDFALIRMLQALAAFSFLVHHKNKSYFMRNIPNALDNIKALFDRKCIITELPELRRLFEKDFFKNPLLEKLREEH